MSKISTSNLQHLVDCINGNAKRNFAIYNDGCGYTLLDGSKAVVEGVTSGECKAALDGIYHVLFNK